MKAQRVGGQLLVGVLSQALKRFGRIDRYNQATVTLWVQKRCREIEQQAAKDGKQLADVDPKVAQMSEGDR